MQRSLPLASWFRRSSKNFHRCKHRSRFLATYSVRILMQVALYLGLKPSYRVHHYSLSGYRSDRSNSHYCFTNAFNNENIDTGGSFIPGYEPDEREPFALTVLETGT